MTRITCPCCGGSGSIEEDAPVALSQQQIRVFDAVRKSKYGISCYQLMDAMYNDRYDGGPSNCYAAMRCQIWKVNKKLKAVGLKIVGTSSGAGSVYKLMRLGEIDGRV